MSIWKWLVAIFLFFFFLIGGIMWYMSILNATENAISRRDITELRQILVDTPERSCDKDFYGLSMMHLAAQEDFPEGIALLAEAGAMINATYTLSEEELEYHKDLARSNDERADYVVRNYQSIEGMTPLHFAVIFHAHKAVHELIRLGADVNLGDFKRQSPLYWAARSWNSEAISVLASSGSDIHAETIIGGFTPLHAVFDSFPEHPNIGMGYAFTSELPIIYYPLRSSPKEARKKTIQALLDAGANHLHPALHGETPVDLCPPDEVSFHFGHLFSAEEAN
ncbi:MAG: ankyrin repeat protein [uncultured bacterium]|nr:MAG: ankyrin repeat protein [uncultured bacterium]